MSCKKDFTSYPPNSLEILYFKPGILYPYSLGCGWVNNPKIEEGKTKYVRIYDKVSMEKFLKLYNKYEIDSTQRSADIRIKILIHQGIKADTLCLGENFGTVLNGKSMKDSKELLNFIKMEIDYDNF